MTTVSRLISTILVARHALPRHSLEADPATA